jgi:hypothetical protein
MKHKTFCETGEPEITMPEDPLLVFKNYHSHIENAVTIYADFEAYQTRADKKITDDTTLIYEQKRTGYGYIVASPFEELRKPVTIYRGVDAADRLVDALLEACDIVEDKLNTVESIEFDENDSKCYLESTHCHICHKLLDRESGDVCRDYCQISDSD